jgi:hypothetical protein
LTFNNFNSFGFHLQLGFRARLVLDTPALPASVDGRLQLPIVKRPPQRLSALPLFFRR